MPNQQKHRGMHTQDLTLFAEKWMPILQNAVRDMVYLLNRGFAENASLKLVGDRYRLHKRQRKALMRSVCSNESLRKRLVKEVGTPALQDEIVLIDGYNLLITTECALSEGILLLCRDGCYRDMASIHGTYRKVEETLPAIHLIGDTLAKLNIKKAYWYLDTPISNSGRLKKILLEEAEKEGWNWEAELVFNPDKTLIAQNNVVISSDSWVIENAKFWCNFNAYLIEEVIKPQQVKFFT